MEKCAKCGVSNEHKPLFRANEKGVPAEWRCMKCLDTPPDPAIKEIVDVLVKGQPKGMTKTGEIIDKSGEPRSIKDLLGAKAALAEYLVKTPTGLGVPSIMVHIPCVLEALSELIARRQSDNAKTT